MNRRLFNSDAFLNVQTTSWLLVACVTMLPSMVVRTGTIHHSDTTMHNANVRSTQRANPGLALRTTNNAHAARTSISSKNSCGVLAMHEITRKQVATAMAQMRRREAGSI